MRHGFFTTAAGRPRRPSRAVGGILFGLMLPVLAQAPGDVLVTIDASITYQTLDGFGQATDSILVYPGGKTLSDSLRSVAVGKAYGQVGLNLGTIGTMLESPGDYDQRQNDNPDPLAINWRGFSSFNLDNASQYVVNLAKPFGFTNYYLGAEAPNVRWGSPWLAEIRRRDYNSYLDEVAEQVLANVTYWKNTHGEELPFYQFGNEELSGNMAMINPDLSGYGAVDPVRQIVDLVKRAGSRLRGAGFQNTRFLVGSEETEEISLRVSQAVLSDPEARAFVGAIGYHSYPYGEGYSSISFILRTSGAGAPDSGRLAVRKQIHDLAAAYGVRVWMTENSNGGAPLLYDDFRARAIQIHDELVYAGASAYFGENAIWDLASQRFHSGSDNLYGSDNEGNVVLVNNDTGVVDITGIGYAIGHYARWAKPRSLRVDASSSDPLVQVTAFRSDADGRLSLVLINNSATEKTVNVRLNGIAVTGNVTGEVSTPSAYWKAIQPVSAAGSGFSIMIPSRSVLSAGIGYAGGEGQATVLSAASLAGSSLAPDSIASVFTSNLPVDTATAPGPAPAASLGGVNVSVRDSSGASTAAPLFFVSPRQMNILLPQTIAAGAAVLTVRGASGLLASGTILVAPISPGVFSANGDGRGVAAAQVLRIGNDGVQTVEAVFQCGAEPGSCRPAPIDLAATGDPVYLIFYGTGLRNVSSMSGVSVSIGGTDARVVYAGAHREIPGLDQINVEAPRLRGLGAVEVRVTVDGLAANVVQIGVR